VSAAGETTIDKPCVDFHFRNQFRKPGFVDYDGEMKLTVNSGLLSVILHDYLASMSQTPASKTPLLAG
jgi:hypothetical protein